MRKFFLGAFVIATMFAGSAFVQQQAATFPTPAPIKRTPLQKFDVPGTNYETVIGLAELAPSVSKGRHTHPGPESGFMLEGEMVLTVEGQSPRTVKVGESDQVAPGAIHDARSGDKGAKVLATYVVEKGKPLASPAP